MAQQPCMLPEAVIDNQLEAWFKAFKPEESASSDSSSVSTTAVVDPSETPVSIQPLDAINENAVSNEPRLMALNVTTPVKPVVVSEAKLTMAPKKPKKRATKRKEDDGTVKNTPCCSKQLKLEPKAEPADETVKAKAVPEAKPKPKAKPALDPAYNSLANDPEFLELYDLYHDIMSDYELIDEFLDIFGYEFLFTVNNRAAMADKLIAYNYYVVNRRPWPAALNDTLSMFARK